MKKPAFKAKNPKRLRHRDFETPENTYPGKKIQA
jgi:hypothetical protein